MKKRLDMLEQLQEIDIQIDVLKSSQNDFNHEISEIELKRDAMREELATLDAQISKLEIEKASLEANLASEQENIRRSETNMKEIKTNKEFQAVGREITAARKQVSELEEIILLKLGQIEQLNEETASKRSDLSELEDNTSKRCQEKLKEIKKLQNSIDSDAIKRDVIIKELPASTVKRYDNLRSQRRGQAIAIAKDGYCIGCNMHLPPQLYNSLFKMDDVISCPHCQRILILKQQTQS